MKRRRISARFSAGEKELLARLATHLHRTQSDTLRVLVYEKANELGLVDAVAPAGLTSPTKRPSLTRRGGEDDSHDVGN